MVIYDVVLRLNLSLIVIYIKHLLVNNKLSSVNINVASLLNGNYILLLFVVLALGLCLGKLRLGSVQLGNSIGVLVVSLLLGQQHFAINTEALNLGFMLFIFCVGVEAGPNFFSIFFRDGKNYLMLALVMVGSAMVLAVGLGKLFHWDIGLTAGMLAGSMTSTPVLVGAGDTLRNTIVNGPALLAAQDHLSLGYALTYLIGLVSLIFGARYLPKLQHQDLSTSAQQIARERGLDTDSQRKVYLPVIRAYRVGPELVAWADGKNLRELGIYRQTGCYIERIRRNGILANPDGDAVLQVGDEISLVGYPDAHARLDPSFRNGKEVFDRDLLDMRIVTEEIVVKNSNAVNKRLSQLKLTDHGQLDQVASVVRRMGKAGDRQIDALPRQQLQRTQLIASSGNGHGFVERVAAKQLELAQHRGAVKGDGGADTRDHRVITLQLAAAIMNGRRRRIDVHVAGERIDDIDAVPAIFRRFTQPLA